MKIFIAAHKKFNPPASDIYVPLHVGAEGKQDLGYLKDNTGDNISIKNPYYCELTGVYWIWKNIKEDVVGLVHYRRYFYKHYLTSKVDEILNKQDIAELLLDNDILVAQRGYTWFTNVTDAYNKHHPEGVSDLKLVEQGIQELYPDYLDAYHKIFNGNHYCQFNMWISKKEIFDEYSKWLFDVLSYVENHLEIPLSERSAYNARVFGFLSERLMNVWLLKNKQYKVKELPVLNIEESIDRQKLQSCVKRIFKGVLG